MIVTIDGPSGTGKTTVARKVAEQLGFVYFDTGAMYRAVTYKVLQNQISLKDQTQLGHLLDDFQFSIRKKDQNYSYYINEEDVTEVIRKPEITRKVSEVSALPAVREALVCIQQAFAEQGDAVFEGRDMGTVVFPQAEYKFYLDAKPSIRAERRYLELKNKIKGTSQEEVLKELMERDKLDSSRELSPLRQAEDAVYIDTSGLSIDAVVALILTYIRGQRK